MQGAGATCSQQYRRDPRAGDILIVIHPDPSSGFPDPGRRQRPGISDEHLARSSSRSSDQENWALVHLYEDDRGPRTSRPEPTGKGTTFNIRPCSAAGRMGRKKILIIDDDLGPWSLRHKLAEWDHEVIEAESGADGTRIAGEESPDLVLLDMKLPDGRGTDFLDEIRRLSPDLPVIMITAYGVIEDVVTAMRRGAYDFITKPFNDPKLQATIQRALEAAAMKKKLLTYREIEQKKFAPGPFVATAPAMTVPEGPRSPRATVIILPGRAGRGTSGLTFHAELPQERVLATIVRRSPNASNRTFDMEKASRTPRAGSTYSSLDETLFPTIDSLGQASAAFRFLETDLRGRGPKDVEGHPPSCHQPPRAPGPGEKFRGTCLIGSTSVRLSPPPAERKRGHHPLVCISSPSTTGSSRRSGARDRGERVLLDYGWPGNVRELKNAVERAMIFEDGALITEEHLPIRSAVPASSIPAGPDGVPVPGDALSLAETENRLIARALEAAGGNVSQAAKLLGIGRDSLRYKLRKKDDAQNE
jgi:CheY-like chemotaxis protein